MIILCIFLMPLTYLIIKLLIFLIVSKFGKLSYDGFSAAGFAYNSKKDIFYSTRNAWQKRFGYCHLYDVSAPIFRMIIDTEPIRFYYNNKNWLITFWKGQYGITTGAEIGIYSTNQKKVNKRTLYLPVKEDEMLDMSFILYKQKEEITRVHAKHWWLAIFKIGMFSKPKDLTMDITLTFPNQEMLKAFLTAFKKIGYKDNEYKVVDNTFYFTFKKPRTHKVWTRNFISDSIRQHFNKRNVKLYNKYLADAVDNNKIDDSKLDNNKLIMVDKIIPKIFKNIPEENIKKIKKQIIEEPSHNVIILNDSVYSNYKRHKS